LAVIGVVLVAAIASLIPASRAASVDPLMALRTE
jgi:ABC-type antimicrobial peptide transport system permease subunit